jgi:two-component system, NtrC family, sensor kinase
MPNVMCYNLNTDFKQSHIDLTPKNKKKRIVQNSYFVQPQKLSVNTMEYNDLVKNLQTKIHKLSYIHQVSHSINSMQSVEELLEYALSESLRSLESESGSIFLWDEDTKELELKVSHGRSSAELRGLKKRLGDGVAGIVARDGKPMLVKNVHDDPRVCTKNKAEKRYKTASFICVPLIAKNKLVGVINVTEKKTDQPFNDDELEFLFIIANHLAIAIDNMQLYKKIQSFNCLLQNRVDKATEELQQIVEESIMLRTYKENIIDSLTKGVFVVDLAGKVTLWNRGMEIQYDIAREKALGQPVVNVLNHFGAEVVIDTIYRVLREKQKIFLEKVAHFVSDRRKRIINYNIFPLYSKKDIEPIGVVVLHDDITDKVELEQELQISERLALIGKLASGIAHELNNPLDGTRRFINLGLDKLREDPAGNAELAQEYIISAKDGVNRMIKTVRALLEFSRQTACSASKFVDINSVISDTINIIKLQQPLNSITIHTELADNLPPVVDYSLQTIFTNLIDNAIDAMPCGGELRVRTRLCPEDPSMVEIEVRDTGIGISEEDRERIFDPFFTTKSVDEGTGLGLSLCQEIIKRSQGLLRVSSEIDQGTTFTVSLPFNNQTNEYRGSV